MPDPTQRFSNRVDDYAKYRPSYPPEVIGLLKTECALTPDSVIADIGSGTGILTRLLLDNGNQVFAVEPNRAMREAAERCLAGYPRLVSVDAKAEETGLPDQSVDIITVAQAFHWFDLAKARIEFRRILRPGGWCVIVRNERKTESSPFLQAYEQIVTTYANDYREVDHRRITPEIVADFFAPNPVHTATFENDQHLDFEGVKGRLLSSSYTPTADQPTYAPMLDALAKAFDQHATDGVVTFEYTTRVFFGKSRS